MNPKLALSTGLRTVSGHYVVRHGTAPTMKGTSTPNMAGARVALFVFLNKTAPEGAPSALERT